MADWANEETGNPTYADNRNFYKLDEKWTLIWKATAKSTI